MNQTLILYPLLAMFAFQAVAHHQGRTARCARADCGTQARADETGSPSAASAQIGAYLRANRRTPRSTPTASRNRVFWLD